MKSKIDEKRHPYGYSRSMKYLNIYECRQVYGGPEEGGWWYDVGTTIRDYGTINSRKVGGNRRRRKKALKKAKEFCAWSNIGRREYHSVLSEGLARPHFCERPAPDHFPKGRQYYE